MDLPEKIIIELVSSEAVRRLEARDDDLRIEIQELEKRLEGLHRTVYDLMNALAKFRR